VRVGNEEIAEEEAIKKAKVEKKLRMVPSRLKMM
jgi:hypothetical protein